MGTCSTKLNLPYGLELVLSNIPSSDDKSKMLLGLQLEYDNFTPQAQKKIDEATRAHIEKKIE